MTTNTNSAQERTASIDLDKLQPCPFCGGPARIESSAMWLDLICDHDKTCCLDGDSAEMSYQNASGARDAMVAKWNRRSLTSGTPADQALIDMEARKDAAYYERNQVVAALAKCFPSGVAKTTIEGWSEDWHGCVYIDLPTGQVSWHFHDSQAHLFANLPPYAGKWDGHDTPEKYRRVGALEVSAGAAAKTEQAACPYCGQIGKHDRSFPHPRKDYSTTAAAAGSAQPRASEQKAVQMFTCKGKGGEYELVGYSNGAGPKRGESIVVYRRAGEDDVLYHRSAVDFRERMEWLGGRSPLLTQVGQEEASTQTVPTIDTGEFREMLQEYWRCMGSGAANKVTAKIIAYIDGRTVGTRGIGSDGAAGTVEKDAERLDWLNQNFFSDQKDEWDERQSPNSIKWKFFGPMSIQGDVRRVIDAAIEAHNKAGKEQGC